MRKSLQLPVLGCISEVDHGGVRRLLLWEVPTFSVFMMGFLAMIATFIYLYHFQMVRVDPRMLMGLVQSYLP